MRASDKVIKPDLSLRSGQLRLNQSLKRQSSETIRKMLMVLVMKWLTLSKKKNSVFWTVRTIMIQLAAIMTPSEIIVRTRRVLSAT